MERRQLFHIGFQQTEHEISHADYMLSRCKSNAFSSGRAQAAELRQDTLTSLDHPPTTRLSVGVLPADGHRSPRLSAPPIYRGARWGESDGLRMKA